MSHHQFLNQLGAGSALVHSDLSRLVAVGRSLGIRTTRENLLESAMRTIESIVGLPREKLVFPAFNYEFSASRLFDVQRDPVQVGALPEMLRTDGRLQRTHVPFFSFLMEEIAAVRPGEEIDPFGKGSFFADLAEGGGLMLMFGAGIKALTFIHHIESSFEAGPLYRYDKVFNGEILYRDVRTDCAVRMHVRPHGISIQYDWEKIASDLFFSEAMVEVSGFNDLLLISASHAKRVLLERLHEDPLYLLTPDSRHEFRAVHRPLTRIKVADFE